MRNLAEFGTINGLRCSDLSLPAVNERFITNALIEFLDERVGLYAITESQSGLVLWTESLGFGE
jgi:hypothetical protein